MLTPCRHVGLDKVERPGGEIPESQAGPRDAHHQVGSLAEDQLVDARLHPVQGVHHLEDVVDVPDADGLVDGVGDEDVVAAFLHQLHFQYAAGVSVERPARFIWWCNYT